MAEVSAVPRIAAGSHVTLHYRIAVFLDGAERELASTFDARPATLTVGAGALAGPLEARLIGLEEGARHHFDLSAGEAYGERRGELVQTLARPLFDRHADPADAAPGQVVRVDGPDGRQVSGVLKQRDEARVVIDFNHPLAGLPVGFTVQIIGVL